MSQEILPQNVRFELMTKEELLKQLDAERVRIQGCEVRISIFRDNEKELYKLKFTEASVIQESLLKAIVMEEENIKESESNIFEITKIILSLNNPSLSKFIKIKPNLHEMRLDAKFKSKI
jgi:hypothetical protein